MSESLFNKTAGHKMVIHTQTICQLLPVNTGFSITGDKDSGTGVFLWIF